MTDLVEIVTTTANEHDAERIARAILDERLAACVNLVPCRSLYRWKGAIHDEGEVLVHFKTTREAAERLEARLREIHGYETPAILHIAIAANDDYARWVEECVRGSAP